MNKNNSILFESLKQEVNHELNSIKEQRKKFCADKKVSFSSLSTYKNLNESKPIKKLNRPKTTERESNNYGPWKTEGASNNKMLAQDWDVELFNLGNYMKYNSITKCKCSDFDNSDKNSSLDTSSNLSTPRQAKNKSKTSSLEKKKSSHVVNTVKMPKLGVIAGRSPYETSISYRVDKVLKEKTKRNKVQIPIKCNFIEFATPSAPDYYTTLMDDDYTQTLNEIKKTRKELIEEYKSMMHSTPPNTSHTTPRFESINFGKNWPFLRTQQAIPKPKFENTLQILIKNHKSLNN